jgi:hypothetical protein
LSRAQSGRGAGAASSARSGPVARRPGVLVQSAKSDIFVVMLAIALGSIVLGCLLMIILFGGYGFSTKVSSVSSTAAVSSIA